jgi:hypothetical protein
MSGLLVDEIGNSSAGRFADNAEGGTELAGIVFSESLASFVLDRIGGRLLDRDGLGGGGELPRLERVFMDLERVNDDDDDTLMVGSSLLASAPGCWSFSSSE